MNCLEGKPECLWSGMAGASDAGERALERKMPNDAVLVGWLST